MLIGELAKKTQCSVRVIRHYEQAGLLLSVRGENGYRQFDAAAVERKREIYPTSNQSRSPAARGAAQAV